ELGFFIAGGKGRASRKTPLEIETLCNQTSIEGSHLIYSSRMSAKVDSAAVQDGYQLYHHSFFFTQDGSWTVVQQGMNETTRYARRYHWLSDGVKDFVCEPHWAVCCDQKQEGLNLVALESAKARETITELIRGNPGLLVNEVKKANELALPKAHPVPGEKFRLEHLGKTFTTIYEQSPKNFEELLGLQGVGPKTLRALSLVSELIHGTRPSFKDPTRFSFAHGGKDGHPYPVDREVYDKTVGVLQEAIGKARVGDRTKMEAIRRLQSFSHGKTS
ncbi:MAG TPA: DUF763 domain-containing protein, partial [Thermodesulfobacteriota bacterium]|nr:DUF763 domain-containing protein [Thermodesulfobacteriota bacterium]